VSSYRLYFTRQVLGWLDLGDFRDPAVTNIIFRLHQKISKGLEAGNERGPIRPRLRI
jgi:hypothetical protein